LELRSIAEVEQLFTLGFALEQMHRNYADLERCVREWARAVDRPSLGMQSRIDPHETAACPCISPSDDEAQGTI
jgi:hypothetical protein